MLALALCIGSVLAAPAEHGRVLQEDGCSCRSSWSYYEDGGTCDQVQMGCPPLDANGKRCDGGSGSRWCIVDQYYCTGSEGEEALAIDVEAYYSWMTCDDSTPVAPPLPDCKCLDDWTTSDDEWPEMQDSQGRSCAGMKGCAQPKQFDYRHHESRRDASQSAYSVSSAKHDWMGVCGFRGARDCAATTCDGHPDAWCMTNHDLEGHSEGCRQQNGASKGHYGSGGEDGGWAFCGSEVDSSDMCRMPSSSLKIHLTIDPKDARSVLEKYTAIQGLQAYCMAPDLASAEALTTGTFGWDATKKTWAETEWSDFDGATSTDASEDTSDSEAGNSDREVKEIE